MDPISQGALGASAAVSRARSEHFVLALLCGIVGGMAPDLDAFIRSDSDPLLYLEYHRQFTHSLIFIPIGGLVCAVVLRLLLRRRLGFLTIYKYATLGYATHGLLDSCTTYGTQLFWPFSDARIAWHTISIIDPLFTIPIIIVLIIGVLTKRALFGRIALAWAISYLSFGFVQVHRAESAGYELAIAREHEPIKVEAKPSFGNLFAWKTIYEYDGVYHVDAVHLSLDKTVYPGTAIEKLDLARDLPWLNAESQQAKDIERFRWFSNGYLALDSQRENFIIDMRYSLLPNGADGLWGIQLDPNASSTQHVAFIWDREVTPAQTAKLIAMVRGQPVPQ